MPSVLIINDHLETLRTFSRVLRLAGFETVTASTGREGIAIALERAFDVLLVDLKLPDIAGTHIVRELRGRGVNGQMIIVTAFTGLDSAFDAGACGADGYVDGFMLPDELVDLVSQALPMRDPDQSSVPHVSAAIDPRIRHVMRLIESDLSKPWSISELASIAGLSESGLRHLFHSNTGQSVTAFRTERRLQAAARRLTSGYEDIKQVAHSVGFAVGSLRDFRLRFLTRFGMLPSAYRSHYSRNSKNLSPIPRSGDVPPS